MLAQQETAQDANTAGRTVVLKRAGARPLHIRATPMLELSGWTEKLSLWYEINVYETDRGQIAVNVKLFHKTETYPDIHRAVLLDDTETAVDYLTNYCAYKDIPPASVEVSADVSPLLVAEAARETSEKMAEAQEAFDFVLTAFMPGVTPQE